ncbi:relaxase/mobilization nuclease domain-containing protein [Ensifer sp. SL37]|uniref:relaxase/mobilization nuclease domain-containing protein n=1 Tax=Ensifer sp. SL37 TaxID=2995137 RepID=UPI002274D05B|nr:hypothetical protein [Ensifer sp. SL37]MCY1740575.1 hypothetical protein [Ensifer sp. SL37]
MIHAENPRSADQMIRGGPYALTTQPAKIRVYRDALAKGRAKLTPRNSAADKAKLARVVSKAPEVMVKISGRTRDSGHLKEHMNYITRNGEVPAETEYGLMSGKEAVGDVHSDWADDEIIYKGQHQVRKAPLSVNMVLSMPPGADREAFRNAVRDFVDAELRPRVDVMLAFHDDTNHPHAHVTVRGRQHNGKTFNPGKPVLELYREQFAGALRNRGIEAAWRWLASKNFASATATRCRAILPMSSRGALSATNTNRSLFWPMPPPSPSTPSRTSTTIPRMNAPTQKC